eukprot:8035429-Pyramimonas_sp.AAC.1
MARVTLLLMLSERRQIDPAYELQCAPPLQFATAAWELCQPRAMLEQGLQDAVARLTDHGNPWASIRGPFSACAAAALRLGVGMQGFVVSSSAWRGLCRAVRASHRPQMASSSGVAVALGK